MEVILSYLENMFLNMPKTPEALRAKEELAGMMEDKYNELLAEGKKQNEVIGIVISEFGDISELAEELGLDMQGSGSAPATADACGRALRMVSRREAEEYMYLSVKTSKWIAAGVMLCIYAPIFLILLGGVNDQIKRLSDAQVVCFGIVPLFVMIGIAVAIFIYNGMKMEKFDYLKKERIHIDSSLDRELLEIAEAEKPALTMRLIIGVALCIFAAIPLIISGSLTDNEMVHAAMVALLLVLIGIAVVIFIIGERRRECIQVLRQETDFTPERKDEEKIVGIIAGIYWPIVTVVYLIWSLTGMEWGKTWIVWPIAGILFMGIAAICNAVVRIKNDMK